MKTNAGKCALLAAAAALTSPAFGAATWKAEIFGPSRSVTQPFESFAKEVAARSGGQLKIEISYDKTKPAEAIELIKSGARDVAYFCSTYFGDKMPLVTVLDLPMLAPDSIKVLAKVELALADHPAIQAEHTKWNAKMLIPVPLSQYQLMGTRRIAKIEDFKGAKVRISAGMGKILEEYGATTNLMPGNETLAGLRSGAIDVVALSYPFSFASFKTHEGAKYVTEKISLGTQFCYFAVNQKSFDALPAKLRETMLGLRQPTVAQYEKTYEREDAAAIELFKKQGIEFVSFNTTDRARLLARAIKYWQAWVEEREKQGLKGKEVFEFAQAKIREFSRAAP